MKKIKKHFKFASDFLGSSSRAANSKTATPETIELNIYRFFDLFIATFATAAAFGVDIF